MLIHQAIPPTTFKMDKTLSEHVPYVFGTHAIVCTTSQIRYNDIEGYRYINLIEWRETLYTSSEVTSCQEQIDGLTQLDILLLVLPGFSLKQQTSIAVTLQFNKAERSKHVGNTHISICICSTSFLQSHNFLSELPYLLLSAFCIVHNCEL